MKRIKTNPNILIAVFATGFILSSCEDPNKLRAEREFNEYRDYVETESDIFDVENDWNWEEYEANWQEYDSLYQEHASEVEGNREYLSDDDISEFEQFQSQYEERKSRYEKRAASEGSNADKSLISKQMYTAMNIENSNDIDLSGVTADNARQSYKNFVDYIEQNKKDMNQADWRNAEIIWEALNLRKNAIEEDISTKDNLAIGTLKVEYGALKSSYGGFDLKDTSNSRRDIGDVTDGMENRSNSPNN